MAKSRLIMTNAIVEALAKTKNKSLAEEKNIPEKVRMIMLGAPAGSPALVKEIKNIIAKEVEQVNKSLDQILLVVKNQ